MREGETTKHTKKGTEYTKGFFANFV